MILFAILCGTTLAVHSLESTGRPCRMARIPSGVARSLAKHGCMVKLPTCNPSVDAMKVRSRLFSSDTQLVKQLRSLTGAPMMECKKSLQLSGNSLEKAIEWLRSQGTAKISSKLEGREVTEGLVGLAISQDATRAALIKVATETDFASRSATFASLVDTIAYTTVHSGKTALIEPDDVLELLIPSNASMAQFKHVRDALDDARLTIRENLVINSAFSFEVDRARQNAILAGYVHNRSPHSIHCGASAALVELASIHEDKPAEQLKSIGKKLAMHIVAAKPKYLSPPDVPTEILEKEKDILKAQIEASGKKDQKPEVIDNIVTGKLKKFFEEVCLTMQPHMVEEGNPSVEKYLSGMGVEVKRFALLKI